MLVPTYSTIYDSLELFLRSSSKSLFTFYLSFNQDNLYVVYVVLDQIDPERDKSNTSMTRSYLPWDLQFFLMVVSLFYYLCEPIKIEYFIYDPKRFVGIYKDIDTSFDNWIISSH